MISLVEICSFLCVYHLFFVVVLTLIIALQVENRLFRVHSYFFIRDSKKFEEELRNGGLQGSKKSPYMNCMQGITPDEFAQFLWVFYNK